MVRVYSGILLSHKEWNNATCTNMDEPRDYHMITIYMWNLKKDTNEFISKTETHRHRKQIYGYQRGEGARGERN